MDAGLILRVLLVITIIVMAGLALVYLRQRELSWKDTLGWALLALLVPLLGPFLVILNRPGRWRKPPDKKAGMHPARAHMFALVGPRRRKQLHPLLSPSAEKKDYEI